MTKTESQRGEPAITTTRQPSVRTPEEHGGRAAVLGASIGFIAVAIAVWMLGLASGLDGITSFGLGVFVGSWGGLGFGGMLAASIAVAGKDAPR